MEPVWIRTNRKGQVNLLTLRNATSNFLLNQYIKGNVLSYDSFRSLEAELIQRIQQRRW